MANVRTNMKRPKYRKSSAGFTLVEVTSVLAIALVVAGTAVPNVMLAVQGLRLSSTTSAAAGLVREMRLRAVSDDRHYTLRVATVGDATLLFADLNANGTLDASEPAVQAAAGVAMSSSGYPDLASMSLDFTPAAAGTALSVNERGVPCVIQGASCKTIFSGSTVGFVYVLSGTTKGKTAWSAITLSPNGHITTWSWSGKSWQSR